MHYIKTPLHIYRNKGTLPIDRNLRFETLIKLYLQKEPPAIKKALKKASALQRW